MPLYDYRCNDCGPFSAIKKMSESSNPALCENCGSISKRLISAPYFALLGQGQRIAHERNEKSAHEPRAGRRSSCGCTGEHRCNTKTEPVKKAEQQNGFQMQTRKTARPWMLGH
jgi:putative FmdB family regulatory protein